MPFGASQVRQNLFFSTLSATICHFCAENDFVLQLFTSVQKESYSDLFKKLYREKRVGGLILTCPTVNNNEIVDLLSAHIPFILVGRPGIDLEQIHYVDVDNVDAAYQATSYLLQLGHRRIGFLNAPPFMTLSEDLRKGMHRAYLEIGQSPTDIIEIHTDLTLESGFEESLKLLSDPQRPTAIFTTDDLMAIGVSKAADQLSLGIPNDLSLVSAAKNGWGELMRPDLTYVDTGFEKLGVLSAAFMMELIEGRTEAAYKQVLPVRLVQGGSCKAL
nr:substrate-binding domain-containing protein [Cohnella sp. REN36]